MNVSVLAVDKRAHLNGKKIQLNIVLVTETLVTGGAETFVLRLAKALHNRGARVALYVLRTDKFDPLLVQSIAPGVPLALGRLPYLKLILKLDGLFFRLGLGASLLRWLQARRLRAYLTSVRPDVVHAHLFTSDLVTARAAAPLSIPWVTTMHGDYEAFEQQGHYRAARIPDFGRALSEVERSVGHMVCITDPQVAQLGRLLPRLASKGGISKIYNGYAVADAATDGDAPVAIAHIPPDAFVIGMVARGIRDKGWDVLIAAFNALDLPDAWLVLVGDGDYLQQIRPTIQNPHIVFCGNVVDPLRYISRFDVACLPSQFPAESLPTVVIEYLYLGKPVIATAVGEIPRMLDAEGDASAGLLIDLGETHAMAEQMKVALMRLYKNKDERARMSHNATNAVQKFDMDACVDAYLDVYQSAQQ